MARFYSDENFERQVVEALRSYGHDVLTAAQAGNANNCIEDPDVLAFAVGAGRIVLTHNRRHFVRLHNGRIGDHPGIVVCSMDSDFRRLLLLHSVQHLYLALIFARLQPRQRKSKLRNA